MGLINNNRYKHRTRKLTEEEIKRIFYKSNVKKVPIYYEDDPNNIVSSIIGSIEYIDDGKNNK